MSALTGPGVSVLSGSCYLSKKKTLLPNHKEIKEDISIVKLNFSNFHKAVITWLKSTETLKNPLIFMLLNQSPSLHNSFDAKN